MTADDLELTAEDVDCHEGGYIDPRIEEIEAGELCDHSGGLREEPNGDLRCGECDELVDGTEDDEMTMRGVEAMSEKGAG